MKLKAPHILALAAVLLGALWPATPGMAALPEVPFGAFKGFNVIYIQMESIQQFLIGTKVEGREITPELNRLAQRGIQFTRCYPQTGMGNTSDGELLAMCSLLPLKDQGAFNLLRSPIPSLPNQLKAMGYHTYAFHGNYPSVWNRRRVYPMIGIERYYHRGKLVNDEIVGLGISDMSLVRQTGHVMFKRGRLKEPFFALVMTLSSHHPYKVPGWDFDPGPFRGTVFGDYLTSTNYADRAVGDFIRALEGSPLARRTLVVIYGDHRAPGLEMSKVNEFLQMNGMDPVTVDPWSQRDFSRVPFIMLVPKGDGTYETGASHVPCGQWDISPTVARLMGFRMPQGLGSDLLGEHRGLVVFPQEEIIYKDYWSAFNGKTVVDTALKAPVMPMVLNPQWEEARRAKDASLRVLGIKTPR
ncbi:MAG: LTA synthase family protein [Thermanaerothrix sp.]|nr:LTA synthase family protein [Thermanaerothrix sp.]